MTFNKIRLFATVSALAVTLGFAGAAHADGTKAQGFGAQAASSDNGSSAAAADGSLAIGSVTDKTNNTTTTTTTTSVSDPVDISFANSFNKTIDRSNHDNLKLVTQATLNAAVTGNRVSVGGGATNNGTIAAAVPVNVNTGSLNGGSAHSGNANGGKAHSGSAEGGNGGDGGLAASGGNEAAGVGIGGLLGAGKAKADSKADAGGGGAGGNGGSSAAAGGNGGSSTARAGKGGSVDQQGDAQAQADSHNVQNISMSWGGAAANVTGVQGIASTSVNSGVNSSVNNQVTVSAAVGSVFSSGSLMGRH